MLIYKCVLMIQMLPIHYNSIRIIGIICIHSYISIIFNYEIY